MIREWLVEPTLRLLATPGVLFCLLQMLWFLACSVRASVKGQHAEARNYLGSGNTWTAAAAVLYFSGVDK